MISRKITNILKERLTKFPVLSLTGPRQSGKTTLLQNEFPDYKYFNLERIDHREMIQSDIMGFLEDQGPGVIFDETQRLPELFSYIQVISDERGQAGQYILSGSQSFLMNDQISQSLAGRTHVSHLFPFGITEIPSENRSISETIFNGFYPRLYDKGINAVDFYPSYIQTYIERDIRSLKAIDDLNSFSRFMGLCAGRIGQVLNMNSLANDTGVTVNTVKSWLSLLEASFILYRLQPYYRNFNKRLIKSPKLYFYDTGIVSSLLKIQDPDMIKTHYMYGSLYENLIISEILKSFHHNGKIPHIYYWRESNGTEIDCLIEKGAQKMIALEIKAGKTFNKDYLKNLKKFPPESKDLEKSVIYAGDQSSKISGINLISHAGLIDFLENLHA